MRILSIIFISLLTITTSCKSKKQVQAQSTEKTTPQVSIMPETSIIEKRAIIYKTKEEYFNLVPVIMNEDKTEIIYAPHPTDLFPADMLLFPSKLGNGFYLDNLGINENVAFLKYTYQEYSRMPDRPSIEELEANIKDRNPIEEMYDCGKLIQYEDFETQVNHWINSGTLDRNCAKIK